MHNILFEQEDDLHPDEFLEVLHLSTLGQRRPTEDRKRITAMVRNANLIITARENGRLVGVARSITDWVFCTYLSDLAVDQSLQRRGIGRELIRRTKMAAPQAMLILLSAPAAINYYPRIAMERHPHAFTLNDVNKLT